ncbi:MULTISPECIES: CHAT domain-containing protein [unclassified Streptomyces]|uniref:CHAT domain-containing protein n=1 Tax=unclassified Streptomyces TaxID=2593676 RepID=UPI0033C9F895
MLVRSVPADTSIVPPDRPPRSSPRSRPTTAAPPAAGEGDGHLPAVEAGARRIASCYVHAEEHVVASAGARSVLAALWPVDDETAPDLMADHHRRPARGVPPAAAPAQAQRHASGTLPPAPWASFVHVGR